MDTVDIHGCSNGRLWPSESREAALDGFVSLSSPDAEVVVEPASADGPEPLAVGFSLSSSLEAVGSGSDRQKRVLPRSLFDCCCPHILPFKECLIPKSQ